MQLTGWLVVNHFLNTRKYEEITGWLIQSADKNDIRLLKRTNVELSGLLNQEQLVWNQDTQGDRPDFVLFWDKDVRLAAHLELLGLRLFNSAVAIEICDDKSLIYLKLLNSGIKMPKTIIMPKIFHPQDWRNSEFIKVIIKQLGLPIIVKECAGSFGEQVYLAKNEGELVEIINRFGTTPAVFQEFIASSFGRDIRIQVVGGKAIAAMYRYSENGDFRANLTNGAKMKPYMPNDEQSEMAIKVCEILSLDFAGVDILFGENEEPVLCEVNSNAHFKNIRDCTGVDAADYIFKYIRAKMVKEECCIEDGELSVADIREYSANSGLADL